MIRILHDEEETRAFGRALGRGLAASDIVFLEGDLGAGKTFLVRAALRGLGLAPEIPVTSPTFTLVNEYEIGELKVLHADLYRLGDARQLSELGLVHQLGGGSVVFIEWAEQFSAALPLPDLHIRLRLGDDETRIAELRANSERGRILASC